MMIQPAVCIMRLLLSSAADVDMMLGPNDERDAATAETLL